MGGSPSKTRKLTVDNDDPTSVIKVSDDVVDRIRGIAQTVRNEAAAAAAAAAVAVPVSPVTPITPTPHAVIPIYLHEPSLTSIQIRQANVAELKGNDEYWDNRLKKLEESHKKMNHVINDEYNKALDELKTEKHPQGLKEIPCLDSKRAVMECYRCYPNEPMRCARIVQAFQECVDYKRSCLLATRGEVSKG